MAIIETGWRDSWRSNDASLIVGGTVQHVEGAEKGSEVMQVVTDRGVLTLFHKQDCCEVVEIEDVTGDPSDLIGGVVTVFEVRSSENEDPPSGCADSWTWTFYALRTTRGDLTVRWLGESNGYYSEEVSHHWSPAGGAS